MYLYFLLMMNEEIIFSLIFAALDINVFLHDFSSVMSFQPPNYKSEVQLMSFYYSPVTSEP